MLSNPIFAVIDTETTGLSPARGDRVIEIGIVLVSLAGEILDTYCTLINPGRSVGPTYIHGIKNLDVVHAPTFSDVAGDIVERLKNTIVVGHNVSFDKRFIVSEFQRINAPLPEASFICTRKLSYLLAENLPSRKLSMCCQHLGINLQNAHSALADAQACAQILIKAIKKCSMEQILAASRPSFSDNLQSEMVWPKLLLQNLGLARGGRATYAEAKHYEPFYEN